MKDRRDNERTLERIARIQGGYFSSAQAREAGYDYRLQHYHASRGNWVKIDRGLYRLPMFPTVENEDWVRWTFWTNGKGIVSHESALALHKLGVFEPRRIHLTVPLNFRKKPPEAVTIHRGIVPPKDIEEGEGYRVTTALRSILDTARYADASILAQSIWDALRRGIVRERQLEEGAKTLPQRAARNLLLAWKEAKARP